MSAVTPVVFVKGGPRKIAPAAHPWLFSGAIERIEAIRVRAKQWRSAVRTAISSRMRPSHRYRRSAPASGPSIATRASMLDSSRAASSARMRRAPRCRTPRTPACGSYTANRTGCRASLPMLRQRRRPAAPFRRRRTLAPGDRRCARRGDRRARRVRTLGRRGAHARRIDARTES